MVGPDGCPGFNGPFPQPVSMSTAEGIGNGKLPSSKISDFSGFNLSNNDLFIRHAVRLKQTGYASVTHAAQVISRLLLGFEQHIEFRAFNLQELAGFLLSGNK